MTGFCLHSPIKVRLEDSERFRSWNLAESSDAGVSIVDTKDGLRIFVTGVLILRRLGGEAYQLFCFRMEFFQEIIDKVLVKE